MPNADLAMDLILPKDVFIDPGGRNVDDVREFFERIISLALEYASSSAAHTPLPEVSFEKKFAEIPDEPLPPEELLERTRSILYSSLNAASPGYVAHMNTIPSVGSIAGDFVAALLDNNTLSVEMSPFLSRLEDSLMRSFAQEFGLGEKSGGILSPGGSVGNLQALVVARNKRFGVLEGGLSRLKKKPVVLASEAAHTSLHKAAMITGLGTDAVRPVRVNRNSQMDTHDLARQVAESRNRNEEPFGVVATVGTTITGNIDPISRIAEIAERENLWLHVDAAYAGAFYFVPEYRNLFAGIDRADSILFNPHKSFHVARTCSMVLFREIEWLTTFFRIPAPYVANYEIVNRSEIGIQGSGHTDVLKLWLGLNHMGLRGFGEIHRECFRRTRYFVNGLKKIPFVELASQPDMNIVCFRLDPPSLASFEADSLLSDIQKELLDEQKVFVSLVPYQGKKWLRVVLMNPFSTEKILDGILDALSRRAQAFPNNTIHITQ